MSKENKEKKMSEGFVWVVWDKEGDPIQAWDVDEETVKKHVKKYGWTYSGLPVFRKPSNKIKTNELKPPIQHEQRRNKV